jgi:hypothetical protein
MYFPFLQNDFNSYYYYYSHPFEMPVQPPNEIEESFH